MLYNVIGTAHMAYIGDCAFLHSIWWPKDNNNEYVTIPVFLGYTLSYGATSI